jgi:hypothetical protein
MRDNLDWQQDQSALMTNSNSRIASPSTAVSGRWPARLMTSRQSRWNIESLH